MPPEGEALMAILRIPIRLIAYAAATLLTLVWIFAAVDALSAVGFDPSHSAGDRAIAAAARLGGLGFSEMLTLARLLAGVKLAIGLVLVLSLVSAAFETLSEGETDDAMLDVAILISALGSAVAGIAAMAIGARSGLPAFMGELILCAIAQELATYGRSLRPRKIVSLPPGPYALPVRTRPCG